MILQTKNSWAIRRIVKTYSLKTPTAIMQSVSNKMNLRILPILELTIHPNVLCLL